MAIDVESYYLKYAPMVFRRCRFMLRDEERAKDAMQEVFVKLLHYKDRLKDEYPSSLLYRIATNICLNIIRSEKKVRESNSEEILETIACYEEPHEKIEALEIIKKIFRGEKESTRTIAVMHFVDGLTLEETAVECGLSVSGVRKRLRNLKEKVRNLNLEVGGYEIN